MNIYSIKNPDKMPTTQVGSFKRAVRDAVKAAADDTPRFTVVRIREHVDAAIGKEAARDQISDNLSRWTKAGWLSSARPERKIKPTNEARMAAIVKATAAEYALEKAGKR